MSTATATKERRNAKARLRRRQPPARLSPLIGRVVHDATDPAVRGMVRTVATNYVAIKTKAGGIARIKRHNVKVGGRPVVRFDERTKRRIDKKFHRVLIEHGIDRDVVVLRARHNGLEIEEALNALLGIGF